MDVKSLDKEELLQLVRVLTEESQKKVAEQSEYIQSMEIDIKNLYVGILKVIEAQTHQVALLAKDTSHLKDCYLYLGEIFYAREFIVGLAKLFLNSIETKNDVAVAFQNEMVKANKEITLSIKVIQDKVKVLEKYEDK